MPQEKPKGSGAPKKAPKHPPGRTPGKKITVPKPFGLNEAIKTLTTRKKKAKRAKIKPKLHQMTKKRKYKAKGRATTSERAKDR